MSTKPNLVSAWKLEVKAVEIYTRKIFNEFQEEFKRLIDLELTLDCVDESTRIYKVLSFTGDRPRTVTFSSSGHTVQCSCKKFEFSGLLCAHVLKVLHMLDLHDLPTQYYLKRWTKDAVAGIILGTHDENMKVDCNPSLTTRYSELSHLALAMATKGCETKQLSLVAKRALLRSLDEIKSYSESHPPHHTEIEERNQDLMGDNITLRDPPRKKVKGQPTRRFKSALEKGKDPQTSIETIERSSRSVVKWGIVFVFQL